MFDAIDDLLSTLFSDITSTFITLFAVGLLVCALGAAFGGDEHAGKFKRGVFICVGGVAVFLLAEPIVQYFQDNL